MTALCPNPQTCEHVSLHGKLHKLADVIPLKTLRWRDYPGLSRWAESNYKSPCKKEAEKAGSEGERFEDVMLPALKMRDETMNQAGKYK